MVKPEIKGFKVNAIENLKEREKLISLWCTQNKIELAFSMLNSCDTIIDFLYELDIIESDEKRKLSDELYSLLPRFRR